MSAVYIDVSDLLAWFRHHGYPSGIPRVITEVLRTDLPREVLFVSAVYDTWLVNDTKAVLALLEYVGGGGVTERARLDRLLFDARPRSRARIRQHDVLYLLGGFWGGCRVASVRQAKRGGAHVAAVVYDMIAVHRPDLCPPGLGAEFTRDLRALVPMLDRVHAISEHTATEVQRYLYAEHGAGNRLAVTVHPLAHGPAGPAVMTDRVRSVAERPFVLCVSTIDRRKNQAVLLPVWERLAAELGESCPRLVLAGGRWQQSPSDVEARIAASPVLSGLVTILPDAPDTELAALYELCSFTTYPSLYEGWGLPVGESLVRGKPCLASSATSIPEVGGDFADYFNPTSPDDAFEAFARYVRAPALVADRAERIRGHFVPRTWADVRRGIFSDLAQVGRTAR